MLRVLVFCSIAAVLGPASAADKVVDQVKILVKSNGKDFPSAGRLYKVMESRSDREFIANVDANGVVDAPFPCRSPVRIWAEPKRYGVTTSEEAKPCGGDMVFQFHVPQFAQSSAFGQGVQLAAEGKPGAAHIKFSAVAFGAAASGGLKAAAQDAAVAQAAVALGDPVLDQFVTRDMRQKYRLVLTEQGQEKLKQFQAKANIETTGQLDFATQKAMANMPRPTDEAVQ
jgi:hypothetical protein